MKIKRNSPGMHITIGIVAMALMETTNPTLNVLWILRQLKMETTLFYMVNGMFFAFLYFVFRVLACGYVSYYFVTWYYAHGMLFSVHASGPFIFTSLTALSFFWFGKIITLVRKSLARYQAGSSSSTSSSPTSSSSSSSSEKKKKKKKKKNKAKEQEKEIPTKGH